MAFKKVNEKIQIQILLRAVTTLVGHRCVTHLYALHAIQAIFLNRLLFLLQKLYQHDYK